MDIASYHMYRDAETDLYPASVLVQYTLTNETEGHIFSDFAELYPESDAPSYKDLQGEWGRCQSKVYVDKINGGAPEAIGWVFVSRQRYEDTSKHYLRGAWITIHHLPPLDFVPTTTREAMLGVELARKPVKS